MERFVFLILLQEINLRIPLLKGVKHLLSVHFKWAWNGKHFRDGLRGIVEIWHINFLSKEIAFPVILHLALDSSDLIYPRIIRLNG